jgi:AcrR family transcriptional regulator
MSTSTTVRLTAEERREGILRAAVTQFGRTGLHGTSTETIAAEVGISQPYLFRLFGTKKELFIAAVRWGFKLTAAAFHEAGEAAVDEHDAFRRIGKAYGSVITDRRYLGIQLQAYAATDDDDIRQVVEEGFGSLVQEIVRYTHPTPEQLAAFLGRGMLMNVAGSLGLLEATEGWASMVRQACIEEIHY